MADSAFDRAIASLLRVGAVVIACLGPAEIAHAQAPFFTHLGIEDGLSQATVYGIEKDTVGFMWFATEDGLNRYDGREFRVFRNISGDSTSLSSNAVISLFVSNDGTLWVGTGDGVDRYDPLTEQFIRYGSSDDESRGMLIYEMTETSDGTIWAATIGRGLMAIDPESGRTRRYLEEDDSEDSLPSNVVGSVRSCDGTNLWVGSRGQLAFVETLPGGEVASMKRFPDTRTRTVYDTLCEPDGTVLLSSDAGLFRARRPDSLATRIPIALQEGEPVPVHETRRDGSGGYWVASYGRGLFHMSASGDIVSLYDPALGAGRVPDERIHSLYLDEAGTIWVGTASHGISRWNPLRRRFVHIAPDPEREDALQSANVWAAIEDEADGDLWVGTTGGIFRMRQDGTFRRYGAGQGLVHEQVHNFLVDADGTLWVAANGGVCYLQRQTDRFHCPSLRAASVFVMQIRRDRDGIIWMATRGGLGRLDPRTLELEAILPRSGEPMSQDIRSILIDDDIVWISSTNGVGRYDQSTDAFTYFAHDPADTTTLAHPVAGSMMLDRLGRLWVGTMGGISIFDVADHRARRITEEHGLANHVIYAMLEDDHGRVWASSNRGLSRVTLEGDDLWSPVSIRNFTPEDGLQSFEFNLHSANRLSDGRMVFGGINGFNIFHPDSVADNPTPPALALTGVSVRGRPYAHPASSLDELRLKHDQSFFTIAFAALDFVSPSQNRYAYRLDALDDDWIDAGTRPIATYTSVPPGRYVFRARGSNGDGVWNEAGISIPVVILPPFWQTWWFRLVGILLIAALLTGVYRARVARLLEMERMRLRIAGDLHDDVGASLGSIILMSDMVRRSDHLGSDDQRRIDAIAQTAREMSADLREIVWIVNPEHDRMDDLLDRLRHAANHLLDGIPHSFDAPESLGEIRIDMNFRRNVLRAFKEILHNARKHAQAGRIDVRITHAYQQLTLTVMDDGRGFHPELATDGHGLKSLSDRMERMGGTLDIQSAPGKGANFICRIPFHANA